MSRPNRKVRSCAGLNQLGPTRAFDTGLIRGKRKRPIKERAEISTRARKVKVTLPTPALVEEFMKKEE